MIAQLDPLYIRTSPRKTLTRLLSYTLFEGRPLTTQGQWINPLVLALFSLQKRLPQLKKVHKPIFIIGNGRSGTTILGKILSIHKDVGFLNEPKALWHSIYPDEDLVGSYSRSSAQYRLTQDDASANVRKHAHQLFGAYLAAVASKRVVDKYPELIFRIPFVKALFPDAKFVLLIRNGWDTCQSIEGWSQIKGVQSPVENHDWWGADNRKWDLLWNQIISQDKDLTNILSERQNLENPIDMATLEWITTMREGLLCMQEYPDCLYTIRYEDLVSQPHDSLQQLLEFCELPADEQLFSYALQTLSPAKPRDKFEIHPLLQSIFLETMTALGY